jgi:hypothetical protein
MWRAFANLEYQSLEMTWLAWHPWLVNLMSHVSVAWEIAFCVLIWKPLWRPLMLAVAVLLHIGIGACLGMWTFGLIMLVGCASFLPNDAVRQLAGRLMQRRMSVTYDEQRCEEKSRRDAGRHGRAEPALAMASANGVAH